MLIIQFFTIVKNDALKHLCFKTQFFMIVKNDALKLFISIKIFIFINNSFINI